MYHLQLALLRRILLNFLQLTLMPLLLLKFFSLYDPFQFSIHKSFFINYTSFSLIIQDVKILQFVNKYLTFLIILFFCCLSELLIIIIFISLSLTIYNFYPTSHKTGKLCLLNDISKKIMYTLTNYLRRYIMAKKFNNEV